MFGDRKQSVVGAPVISIQEVYFEEEYVAPVTCIVSFKKIQTCLKHQPVC